MARKCICICDYTVDGKTVFKKGEKYNIVSSQSMGQKIIESEDGITFGFIEEEFECYFQYYVGGLLDCLTEYKEDIGKAIDKVCRMIKNGSVFSVPNSISEQHYSGKKAINRIYQLSEEQLTDALLNASINLNSLAQQIEDINKQNGWRDQEHEFGTHISRLMTEVGEVVQADMHDKHTPKGNNGIFTILTIPEEDKFRGVFESWVKDTVEDEFADIIICTLGLCDHLGIDIQSHVHAKMRYNKNRGYHHGGKKY